MDEVIPKSIKDFVSSPIESLRSGLGNITDGIGNVSNIMNEGVETIWQTFSCIKK